MIAPTDFRSLTPMIPAGESLQAGLDDYVSRLGFTCIWQTEDMAEVRRGVVALHLIQNGDRAWAENCSCSIGVSDLDALYAEYQTASAWLGPLETKSWGRREFHMILPSGVCLQFYAAS